MKIQKADLPLLFSAASRAAERDPLPEPGRPTSAAALPADPEPRAPAGLAPAASATLVGTLKRICPALWRKLGPGQLTRKEKRTRLLELLDWFCKKNGFEFEQGTRQYYLQRKARVEGRLHATVRSGAEQAALELCFTVDEASAHKLRNAYLQGKRPLLLWLGQPIGRVELLAKVSQLVGATSHEWLDVALLEDGGAKLQATKSDAAL